MKMNFKTSLILFFLMAFCLPQSYGQFGKKNKISTRTKPSLQNIKSADDLKKLNLKEILFYSLSNEQQTLLNDLAPESISVPSGSNIKIKYQSNGEAPILAARLQELFGMKQTPYINKGQQNLLIHLLSPGFKPVQVTRDLESFWSNTYFEVKKELKRRYPKHYWPEDPLIAEAVKGVKRKN